MEGETKCATIHRVTMAQFIRMIVLEARRRRQVTDIHSPGHYRTQATAAEIAGYAVKTVNFWETGRRTPSLTQALDYLEAVRAA